MTDEPLEWPFEEYDSLVGERVAVKDDRIPSRIASDNMQTYPVVVNGFVCYSKVRDILHPELQRILPNTSVYHEHCHPFLDYGQDILITKDPRKHGSIEEVRKHSSVESVTVHDGAQQFQPTPREVGGVVEIQVEV